MPTPSELQRCLRRPILTTLQKTETFVGGHAVRPFIIVADGKFNSEHKASGFSPPLPFTPVIVDAPGWVKFSLLF